MKIWKIIEKSFGSYLMMVILIMLVNSCSNKVDIPPNIIIILIDDAGYADFGFMGSKDLKTPCIDELARHSVVFSDAHTSATVCGPSRAGLLSGQYQQRFGFECNDLGEDDGLDTSLVLLSGHLKNEGYATCAIGKWHLGLNDIYHPNSRGFDEFYGFLGGARSYFPYDKMERIPRSRKLYHNKKEVSFEGYLTDYFGDKTVEFIDNYKDKPFFIYFSPNAVHAPMEAKKKDLERFTDAPRQKLAAMTWSLDENIGKIVDKLSAEGIFENTLIFFMSDNGGALSNNASCLPLKGWKGNKFEGGHRVPFFVCWPKKIKHPFLFDGLASALDIYPTALNAADVAESEYKTDGTDMMAYLTGKIKGSPHDVLFWRKDKMAAVRKDRFKLIRLKDYGTVLYNLDDDLSEKKDLSDTDAILSNELIDYLAEWEKGLKEPFWLEDERWNKVNYEIHKALMENRKPLYKNPKELENMFIKN